jgi:flagellar biosynthesis/type III secretory pathway protein FliH
MKDFVPLVPAGSSATWKRQAQAASEGAPSPTVRSFQRSLPPAGAFAGGLTPPSDAGRAGLRGAPEEEEEDEDFLEAEEEEEAFVTPSNEELGIPDDVPPVYGPDPELLARLDELEERDAARTAAHDEAMAHIAEREREMSAASARLVAAAKGLDSARHTVITEIREGVGPVILEAARRIAGDQLHVDPRLLDAVVEEAVRALGRDGLLVRVSSQDAALIRSRLAPLGIEVVEDPGISAGAICEGPTGRIDASLEAASEAIQSVLDQWRAAP